MHERDVILDEALELLAKPLSSHEKGTRENRREVAGTLGSRTLKVVYERFASDWVAIITVHQV
jgi:hypothetical protein